MYAKTFYISIYQSIKGAEIALGKFKMIKTYTAEGMVK